MVLSASDSSITLFSFTNFIAMAVLLWPEHRIVKNNFLGKNYLPTNNIFLGYLPNHPYVLIVAVHLHRTAYSSYKNFFLNQHLVNLLTSWDSNDIRVWLLSSFLFNLRTKVQEIPFGFDYMASSRNLSMSC